MTPPLRLVGPAPAEASIAGQAALVGAALNRLRELAEVLARAPLAPDTLAAFRDFADVEWEPAIAALEVLRASDPDALKAPLLAAGSDRSGRGRR